MNTSALQANVGVSRPLEPVIWHARTYSRPRLWDYQGAAFLIVLTATRFQHLAEVCEVALVRQA